MNSVFSVDDLDALWHSQMMAATPELPCQAAIEAAGGDREKMNRSASEWAFERFIQEASNSPAVSESSVAGGGPSIGPSVTSQVSSSKPEGGDDDVVEIEKPPLPCISRVVTVDSDEYQQAYLRSRLDLACASVAMSRGGTGKPLSSTLVDEKEHHSSNPTKLGSEALGPGTGFSMEQHNTEGGPLDVPILPALQKKPAVTTSESYSDDDDLEGDTETTGNRYPTDDKRARRMQSNRDSARRSRRRKQEHLTELEKQVSQLKVENTSLSERLTDVNQKYKDAAVDNRVLRADIETLRAKVKMAEEGVKRATVFNPLLQTVPDISSFGSPFVHRPSDLPAEQIFHQPVPSITGASRDQRLDGVLPNNLPAPPLNGLHDGNGNVVRHKIGMAYPPQGVASVEPMQKRIPVGAGLSGAMPGHNGKSSHAVSNGKK